MPPSRPCSPQVPGRVPSSLEASTLTSFTSQLFPAFCAVFKDTNKGWASLQNATSVLGNS